MPGAAYCQGKIDVTPVEPQRTEPPSLPCWSPSQQPSLKAAPVAAAHADHRQLDPEVPGVERVRARAVDSGVLQFAGDRIAGLARAPAPMLELDVGPPCSPHDEGAIARDLDPVVPLRGLKIRQRGTAVRRRDANTLLKTFGFQAMCWCGVSP